jgi:type IV secretion system protein VirB10
MSDTGRGPPESARRTGSMMTGVFKNIGLAAVALGVLSFAMNKQFNPDTTPPQNSGGSDTITPSAPVTPVSMGGIVPPVMPGAPQGQVQQPGGPVMPAGTLIPSGPQQNGPRRVTSFAAKTQQQPSTASATPTGGIGSQAPEPLATSARAGAPGRQEPTMVGFGGSTMPGLRAGAAIDLTFVMQPGLYKLVLGAPINSERGGTFFGLLPEAIQSSAGVLLMERGSRIWGAYKSEVGPGQERIVSVAAWGLTPNGVPVPLGDAAVGDGSGRAGMPGTVNTHFWSKFGGAITLMVTQGAFQVAGAALQSSLSQGGSNSFVNLNTSSLDQALTSVLRNSMNVQNTVDVPAGTEISFMLNQPIDFADAYRLAPTGAR